MTNTSQMQSHRVTMVPPDPELELRSALTSAKSVLAIVNGLTLTNALLVLITDARYERILLPKEVHLINIAFTVVLIVNIVRFYHGNVRHLDAVYGAAHRKLLWSDSAESRGGLGLDFFVIFSQSLIFAVASFYVTAHLHSTYLSLFMLLLGFDIIWTVYSQRGEAHAQASPQRAWLLNNLVAIGALIGFYLAYRAGHGGHNWALNGALCALAATTVVDFALNWRFYFPNPFERSGRDALKVFLSAPLTQYTGDLPAMTGFRAHWERVITRLSNSGHQVFSAHVREDWGLALDPPAAALMSDLSGVLASDVLVAYVGNPPSPGVQFELGCAITASIPTLIFIDAGQATPYLVRGMHTLPNVDVVDVADTAQLCAELEARGLLKDGGFTASTQSRGMRENH